METESAQGPFDGLSLITGIGRRPLTRREVDAIGRLMGTTGRSVSPTS